VSAVLHEYDGSIPLTNCCVAWKGGAALDPQGKEGVTRLVMRLIRRTPGGRKAEETSLLLDSWGASVSADVGRHLCSLHGTALSENTERLFDLLVEILHEPHFDEREFEQLRGESVAEWQEGLDSDRSLAFSYWERRVFGGAYRPASGTLTSLSALTLNDVKDQFAKILALGQPLVASSGDHSQASLQGFANRVRFEGSAVCTPEPVVSPQGRRLIFVDKPERTQSQIVIGGMGAHPHDEDFTALHVANTVFGGTFTARLSQEIRVKRGWSYGAYSYMPLDRGRSPFSIWTFPEAADTADCIALTIKLLEQWVERGITPAELKRAQRYLANSHPFSIDTASKRIQQALDEQLYDLPPGYYEEYLDRIRSVTVESANAALRRRIQPENLTLAVVGTHSVIGSSVASAIPFLAETEVVPFDNPT
jgi:zinc protease